MRLSGFSGFASLVLLATSPLQGQAGSERARDHLYTGAYADAIEAITPLSRGGAGAPAAVALHVRALRETGQYDDALELLGGRNGSAPSIGLERLKGEVLLEVGEWDLAEAAFARSVTGAAPDMATARLRLGEQAFQRGRRAEAMEVFDSFISLYNDGRNLGGEDLMAVGRAVTWLGREQPDLFQDALRAYDEAREAIPADPRPLIAVGDLFLSKYTSPDAHEEYRAVLSQNPQHPDALLGEAKALHFDGAGNALATVARALEINPNHVGALTFMAELRLQTENVPGAIEMAEMALDVNPRSLEAKSLLAAAWYIAGNQREFARLRDEVLALNPVYPDLFTRVAEISVDTRKYASAVEMAGRAVQQDSMAWEAWGVLGMNQLRTGQMRDGRIAVEKAFAGDPYNPWFKNTLDLLDKMDGFSSVTSEHFEIWMNAPEAELLGPYAIQIAEEAFAAMSQRYGAEPPTPIRLEIFPNSADFSVRTLGLVGLGALGVSFGSTLVMDSPSARDAGEFNWASVMWHEIAHAFHLGMSDHNVPRWFSEGLAVREQRVARPYWGHRATIPFLQMWADGQMPPVSRMNEAFVRPAFPGQVVLAYYQGSLVFDWIEEEWGMQAIRDFLIGYRDGQTTGQLTARVLGMADDELDSAFEDYVRGRFGDEIAATTQLQGMADAAGDMESVVQGAGPSVSALRSSVRSSPGSFPARMALAWALLREEDNDGAEEHFRAARRLFPEYAGLDGPLDGLARIHIARGETQEAADALRALGQLNEAAFGVRVREADLRRELGDVEGEIRALTLAVEVFPFDLARQQRLGVLAMDNGDPALAVEALRAAVALNPVDMAEAQFQLARAHLSAGDRPAARSAILRALEIAPSYGAALDLLLEIRGGGQ